MRIPIPKLLRLWREKEQAERLSSWRVRAAYGLWAFAAKRPWLYRAGARLLARILARFSEGKGRIADLPYGRAWTGTRDFPSGQGETFQAMSARRKR